MDSVEMFPQTLAAVCTLKAAVRAVFASCSWTEMVGWRRLSHQPFLESAITPLCWTVSWCKWKHILHEKKDSAENNGNTNRLHESVLLLHSMSCLCASYPPLSWFEAIMSYFKFKMQKYESPPGNNGTCISSRPMAKKLTCNSHSMQDTSNTVERKGLAIRRWMNYILSN